MSTLNQIYAVIRRNVPTLPARDALAQARIVAHGDVNEMVALLLNPEAMANWFARLTHKAAQIRPVTTSRVEVRRAARFTAAYNAKFAR